MQSTHSELLPPMSEEEFRHAPDAVLVLRLQQYSDSRAMVELYDRYKTSVLAACCRVLQDRASAEDIAQETFLRVYSHIHEYRAGNFTGWILTIARNLCLNQLQKASTRTEINGVEERLMELPASRDMSQDPARLAKVLECLGELSDEHRIVLKLIYMEGYSYKEAAERTRFSEDKVRSAAQNGRRMFAKIWKRKFGGEEE